MLRGVQNGGKKGMRDDGKALERKHDKKGVVCKNSGTNYSV